MARYSVNNYTVETLLSNIKSGSIAIPEMQRPFVWDSSKVRDLVDSLYKGFPVGYIIVWQNPDVKLKDGTKSSGKKVLIDGQQRITAMAAAIVGQEVLDDHYKWKRISIAFNPVEEKFEVANNAILKSSKWIPDIAPVLEPAFDTFSFVMEYCQKNEITDQMSQVNNIVNRLRGIQNNSLGVITLAEDLDIDSVTEIFIRINSKGVVLSQADFAMSKISSNETYGGNVTRKTIDYFCHLLESPEDLKDIKTTMPHLLLCRNLMQSSGQLLRATPYIKLHITTFCVSHSPINLNEAAWRTLLACCQVVILKQENSKLKSRKILSSSFTKRFCKP